MQVQLELFKNFQEYLEVEKGLSENSISSYTSDLKKLVYFLDDHKIDINKSTQKDVSDFLKEETLKNKSNRTKARLIAALRQFFSYIEDLGVIQDNPMQHVEIPKIENRIPVFLTKKEVDILFSRFDKNNILEYRDKLLFELLYSCGLRISEACSIKLSDIDYKDNIIHVKGKGDKERLAVLGEVVLDLLDIYIKDIRNKILNQYTSDYLLVSKKGSALNRKSAWRLLKKYMDRTTIKKSITPHTLRHSFATHLLQNGADIKTVQNLLGHMDASTTQIYTHIVNPQLKKVHKIYHPRS